jgi:transcription initiation factor TFIIIB Brf1 subunit/transcription initiation factor TFIIB
LADESKCPECGSTKLFTDNDTGEVVCGGCGVVVSVVDYAPPPERVPKIPPKKSDLGTLDPKITRIHVSSSKQRGKMQLELIIDKIRSRLGLPESVVAEAYSYATRLESALARSNEKLRLTYVQRAALATWIAINNWKRTMTSEEYEAAVASVCPWYRTGTLFKLQKTAVFLGLTNLLNSRKFTVKDFIHRITAQLGQKLYEYSYLNAVDILAQRLTLGAADVLKNRDPALVAAAAVYAADCLLAAKLQAEEIAEAAGVGAANVKYLSSVMRRLYDEPLTPRELSHALTI